MAKRATTKPADADGPEGLEQAYAILAAAEKSMTPLLDRGGMLLMHARADTSMAVGQAFGILDKVRALIGRDIDDMKPEPFTAEADQSA